MKANRVNRKIMAYAMHAEGRSFAGDYEQIFRYVSELDISQRYLKFRGDTVIINYCEKRDRAYFVEFIITAEDIDPLIVNTITGQTRIERLGANEALGVISHALVYPDERRAIVEYVKSGVKAELMAFTVQELLVQWLKLHFRISFQPLISKDFLEELERFRRIRSASISLSRPNAGWNDHYTRISSLMDDSGAGKAELVASAARGESLNKDDGIVNLVREVANDRHPYMTDAEVVGIKEGEEAESKLPLRAHTLNTSVSISRGKRRAA